jgi:hypothetical protein
MTSAGTCLKMVARAILWQFTVRLLQRVTYWKGPPLVLSCIPRSFQRDRKAYDDLCQHVAYWKGPLVWSLSSRFEKFTSVVIVCFSPPALFIYCFLFVMYLFWFLLNIFSSFRFSSILIDVDVVLFSSLGERESGIEYIAYFSKSWSFSAFSLWTGGHDCLIAEVCFSFWIESHYSLCRNDEITFDLPVYLYL